MQKFNILNKSLDIWEAKDLTEKETKEKIMILKKKELEKSLDDWKYEYEIRKAN